MFWDKDKSSQFGTKQTEDAHEGKYRPILIEQLNSTFPAVEDENLPFT